MTDNPVLPINCKRKSNLPGVEDIVLLNAVVTETTKAFEEDLLEDAYNDVSSGDFVKQLNSLDMPEMDFEREEDYHHVRNRGILETLVETILPLECKENNDVLWLASVIMTEIASHQAFGEGNKRTAYLTSTVLLINSQRKAGMKQTFYPLLNTDMTEMLSSISMDEIGREELYQELKEKLGDRIRNELD
jgi:hypothetical protein